MSRLPPNHVPAGAPSIDEHRPAHPITLPPLLPAPSQRAFRQASLSETSPLLHPGDARSASIAPHSHLSSHDRRVQSQSPSLYASQPTAFIPPPTHTPLASGSNDPAARPSSQASQSSLDHNHHPTSSTSWSGSPFANRGVTRQSLPAFHFSRWRSLSSGRAPEPSGLPSTLPHSEERAAGIGREYLPASSDPPTRKFASNLLPGIPHPSEGANVPLRQPSLPHREAEHAIHHSAAPRSLNRNSPRRLLPQESGQHLSRRRRSRSPSPRNAGPHRHIPRDHAPHLPHEIDAQPLQRFQPASSEVWAGPSNQPVSSHPAPYNTVPDMSPTVRQHLAEDLSVHKSSKRIRISRACDPCRRRKTKCDVVGVFPGEEGHPETMASSRAESKNDMFILRPCSNCVRARVPCTYLKRPPKRTSVKEYVKELEGRLAALEAQRPSQDAAPSGESDTEGEALHLRPPELQPDADDRLSEDQATHRLPSTSGRTHDRSRSRKSQSRSSDADQFESVSAQSSSDHSSEPRRDGLAPQAQASASTGLERAARAFPNAIRPLLGPHPAGTDGFASSRSRLERADVVQQAFLESDLHRALPFRLPTCSSQAASSTCVHTIVDHMASLQRRQRGLVLPPLQERDYAWRRRSSSEARQYLASLAVNHYTSSRTGDVTLSPVQHPASVVQQVLQQLPHRVREQEAERAFDCDLHLLMVLHHFRRGVAGSTHLAAAKATLLASPSASDRSGRYGAVLLLTGLHRALFAGSHDDLQDHASMMKVSSAHLTSDNGPDDALLIDLLRNLPLDTTASAFDRAILLELVQHFVSGVAISDEMPLLNNKGESVRGITVEGQVDEVEALRRDLRFVLRHLDEARVLLQRMVMIAADDTHVDHIKQMVDQLECLADTFQRFRTLATLAGPVFASTALSIAHLSLTAVALLRARCNEQSRSTKELAQMVEKIVTLGRQVVAELASAASADVLGLQHLYWTCQDFGERLLDGARDIFNTTTVLTSEVASDLWTQTSAAYSKSGPLGGINLFA